MSSECGLQVKEIHYNKPGDKVRVVRDNGEAIDADAVVVAVPLPILRSGEVRAKLLEASCRPRICFVTLSIGPFLLRSN